MAITDPRVIRWAETLTHFCLDVQPGEVVGIQSTPLAEPLIREVYRSVLQAGGYPLVALSLPALRPILLAEGSTEQIGWRSPIDHAVAQQIDKRLRISADPNPLALATIDPARQAHHTAPPTTAGKRATRSMEPPSSPKYIRWCGTLWPTEGSAQLAGMSLGEFEEFVFAACFLNHEDPAAQWMALGAQQQRAIDWLRGKDTVHIVAEGTDLTLRVGGRTFINSDGKRNFPSGEFFTGPIEDSAHGTIHFDIPSARDGRIVRDVRLTFAEGKVVEAHAAEGEDYLRTMLDLDEGARRLGEFAFGNNFGITRGIINTLYDEKIGGTIHMALGESYPETGGLNHSAIHWDFICDLRRGGEVTIDDIPFLRDGKFIVAW